MQVYNLNDFTRGWVVGNFSPTLAPLDAAEVGIKRYRAGDYEPKHMHKIADEITIVIDGNIVMGGKSLFKNDIIVINKGESVGFSALTDATICVIKVPFAKDDKYLV